MTVPPPDRLGVHHGVGGWRMTIWRTNSEWNATFERDGLSLDITPTEFEAMPTDINEAAINAFVTEVLAARMEAFDAANPIDYPPSVT